MTKDIESGSARYSYDEAERLTREAVLHSLTAAPRLVREYTGHLAKSRGKYIRAASLLSCALDGDALVHENAVSFAAAVELLHLATLVHDDVIDDAPLRRGLPTLQEKYGKRTAVICGDYLLCAAVKLGADVKNREDYLKFSVPDYAGRVCLGELYEHVNNRNFGLTAYRYLKIIGGKTAALFEASFYAGAVLFTEEERLLKRYARLGRYVGMIFQLTDDCIDYEAEESAAKKPVRSDYEQGVVTLPLIYTLAKDPAFAARVRDGSAAGPEVGRRIAEAGGLRYTREISHRYYEKALRLLGELNPTAEKRQRLSGILERAIRGLCVPGQAAR